MIGAEGVDRVTVLAGTACIGANPIDPVVRNQRTVGASGFAPEVDGVVAGVFDCVVGNRETGRIARTYCSVSGTSDLATIDPARRTREPDRM